MSHESGQSNNIPQLTLRTSNGQKTGSKRSSSTLSEEISKANFFASPTVASATNGHKISRRSSWKDSDGNSSRASSESSSTEPFIIMSSDAVSEATKSSKYISSASSGEDRRIKESSRSLRSGRSPPKAPLTAVSDDGGPDVRPRAKAKKYPAPVSTAMLTPSSRSRSDLRASSGQSQVRSNQSPSTTATPEIEALFQQVKALEVSIRNEFASLNGRQFGSLLDLVGRLKSTLQPQSGSSTNRDSSQNTFIAPQVSSERYMRLGREYQDVGTQTAHVTLRNARVEKSSSGDLSKQGHRDDTSRPRKNKLTSETRRQPRSLSRTPPHKTTTPDFSVIRIGGHAPTEPPPESWHSHLDLLRSLDDSEEELRRDASDIAASPSQIDQRGLAGPCPIEMLQGEDDNSAKSDEAASRDSPVDYSQTPSPRKSWTSSARWTISPRQPSPNDDNRSSEEESSEGGYTPIAAQLAPICAPITNHINPSVISRVEPTLNTTAIRPCASPVPDVQCPTTRRLIHHHSHSIDDLTGHMHKLSLPFQPGTRSAFAPKRVSEQGA